MRWANACKAPGPVPKEDERPMEVNIDTSLSDLVTCLVFGGLGNALLPHHSNVQPYQAVRALWRSGFSATRGRLYGLYGSAGVHNL